MFCLLPVRKVQPSTSAFCFCANCLSTLGESRLGSELRVMKWTCLPNNSGSRRRTSLSCCVISGQASAQWV